MVGGGADGLDEAQKGAQDTDDVLFNERNNKAKKTTRTPEEA
jgi:hypothetical protein